MKKIYASLVTMLLMGSVFAQAPESMSYQAVIRDNSNTLLNNKRVGIRISILQGTINGTPSTTAVYTETQNPTTNANGLVSMQIGTGTTTNTFSAINWSAGSYFIQTETDPSGGNSYSITGVSQLMSVPYALYAKTAGSCPTVLPGTGLMPPVAKPEVPPVAVLPANYIDFATAGSFSIFTISGAVSNAGNSTINGNVGTNLGAITGLIAATVVNGIVHTPDAATAQAAIDLMAAYVKLSAIAPNMPTHAATFGGGEILLPGVYSIAGACSVSGDLYLNAGISTSPQFIINIGGAFTTAANTTIHLGPGVNANNVFIVVQGAAALAATTVMPCVLIANNAAVSIGAGCSITGGSIYSTAGAIAMSTINATGLTYTPPAPPAPVISPLDLEISRAYTAELSISNALTTESARAMIAEDKKENTSNKNTDANLGMSDELFPTQNAVKTYVDNSSSISSKALNTEISRVKDAEADEKIRALAAESLLAPLISPKLITPDLGTPYVLVGTNISGTATNLTAGTVMTNANLSGDITSTGNVTTLTTSGVTAGSYGGIAVTPVITVDAKGRVTSVSNVEAAVNLQEESVEILATAGLSNFTLSHVPSGKILVKMFINGVLISQTAHSNSRTSETYIALNNGGYTLVAGDRVQLYYSYSN